MSLTTAAATADAREGWPAFRAASLPVTLCPNPAVVPPVVHQCSGVFDPLDLAIDADALMLAETNALGNATPSRIFEFLAGRICVAEALRALGVSVHGPVPRRPNGIPAWPAGTTGSITHTKGFVSAAVASTAQVAAVGIDSETILSAARARRVAGVFSAPAEIAVAEAAGLDRETAVTLLFSAKESIFKALHPWVGRVFDFHDVRLAEVDGSNRRFTAVVQQSLSAAFPAGSTVAGGFAVDTRRVHTGMVVPRRVRE